MKGTRRVKRWWFVVGFFVILALVQFAGNNATEARKKERQAECEKTCAAVQEALRKSDYFDFAEAYYAKYSDTIKISVGFYVIDEWNDVDVWTDYKMADMDRDKEKAEKLQMIFYEIYNNILTPLVSNLDGVNLEMTVTDVYGNLSCYKILNGKTTYDIYY